MGCFNSRSSLRNGQPRVGNYRLSWMKGESRASDATNNIEPEAERTAVPTAVPAAVPSAAPPQNLTPIRSITTSSNSVNYRSMKYMIITNVAGEPHNADEETVEAKMQEIRDELEGHNNENATAAEKEYFIEQRCWQFYYPDHEEMFMGHRPRNEAVKRAATYCTGCIIEEQSMDLCPWNVLTSCPIWHHEKYNVRFGEEGLSECPQCRAENCERS